MNNSWKRVLLRESFPSLCWSAWGTRVIAIMAITAEEMEEEGHTPLDYGYMLRAYSQLRRVRLRVLEEMIDRAFAASYIIEDPEEVYKEMKEVLHEGRVSGKSGS